VYGNYVYWTGDLRGRITVVAGTTITLVLPTTTLTIIIA
jgi:hypothetical protein